MATASAHACPASSDRRWYQPYAHATASGMEEVDGTRSLRKHPLRSRRWQIFREESRLGERFGNVPTSIRLLRFASRPQPQIRFAFPAMADARDLRQLRRIGRLGIGAQQ